MTWGGKPLLAGFFSAKLRCQVSWLPCEVKALSIAIATKHFSPCIIQLKHNVCILTDRKPCVQAFEKLCRGEFSTNPHVSTYLSCVSCYQASVRDQCPFRFRCNAATCEDLICQICSFTRHLEDSVVQRVSTEDIIKGNAKLSFTSMVINPIRLPGSEAYTCSLVTGYSSIQKIY